MSKRRPRRIAIWRTGYIGDVVCALPAATVVARQWPHARITLLTNAAGAGAAVARRCAAIDDVHTTDGVGRPRRRQARALALWLRRAGIDTLVYLPQDRAPTVRKARDLLLARAGGVRRVIGFEWRSTHWWRSRRRPANSLRVPNEVRRLLDLVAAHGIDTGHVSFGLEPTAADRRGVEAIWAAEALWPRTPLVAMAPGSRMTAKRWPVRRFAAVADALANEVGATILVVGSQEDRCLADRLIAQLRASSSPCGRSHVLNLCGRTDIGMCVEVLRRCDLYVGNDTGPMHLAAAVGTPCVAVFSWRDTAGAWDPYGDRHTVIRRAVPCRECLLEQCDSAPPRCLDLIDVDAVVQACLPRLAAGARRELPVEAA